MVKKLFFLLVLFSIAIFLFSTKAQSAPAFARQTGFSCNTCHFQHFPLLNAFGRAFKAGGYTMVGGQSLIEGNVLSMPATLNASIVTKIRYQKSNGPDDLAAKTNRGDLQFPDEGAFLLGGRIGENIGFLLEAQFVDPDGSAWASFKMPFVYETNGTTLSFIPFTTDAAGSSYGFELLNTGALRMQRAIEHRTETSAANYINTQDEATGFSFVASRPNGYINYTAWSPEHGSTDAKPYLHYIRAALTPTVGTWDLGLGLQLWDGETRFSDEGPPAAFVKRSAEAWAVDFQGQGTNPFTGKPLGVYLSYAEADKSGTVTNLFNAETFDSRKAFTALAEAGVIPDRATITIAYRDADTGEAADSNEDALTVGATYLVAQNVQLQINHSWYDYDVDPVTGDRLLTLMVFAAF